MDFQYPEDRDFFAHLLAGGDVNRLEGDFKEYFDFRHPAIKREEFNQIKKKVFDKLFSSGRVECELKIHPDCSKIKKFCLDHFIPLSTNELNKKLRHLEAVKPKKVPRQSFGSNNIINFRIACMRCNAYKKHKFYNQKAKTLLF